MEVLSSYRSTPCARMRTSLSVGSLDLGLLVNTPFVHSLMSESFTFCSLSSASSKSLEVPPILNLHKLPTFEMIELGDQLKMFSSVGIAQPKDKFGRTLRAKSVLISTPTFSRLKSMLKECLNISKWVETSAGWQPPGHVPWESVKDTADTYWVPEGAIFPPDYFSVALSKSRRSHRDIQMHLVPSVPSSLDELMCIVSPFPHHLTEDSMNVELLDMMRELKSIRSYFQDPQNICEQDDLSPPSLVVSTSHFTMPIPLESSRSISRSSLNSLAVRRGKKIPPKLLLPKSKSAQEISYPGIPTAFLGSPSQHHPNFEHSNGREKPSLEFEEMINNLRLQCSTMSLQTPPIDTSWNSRSTTEYIDQLMEEDNDDWSFAKDFLSNHKQLSSSRPVTGSSSRDSRPPPIGQSVLRGKRSLSQTILVPGRKTGDKKTKEPVNASSPITASGSDVLRTESLPLRSAMTKPVLPPRLKPSKSVRFRLTHQEFQKAISPTTPLEESTPQEEAVSTPVSSAKLQYQKVLKHLPSTVALSRGDSQRRSSQGTPSTVALSRGDSQRSSSQVPTHTSRLPGKARSTSVASGSPRCQSTTTKSSSKPENTKDIPPDAKSRISMQSLGRRSLSRIIKGPIFPARDKRATISSVSVMTNDENCARRESVSNAFIHRKSRMSVPLRNILTRFK